MKLQISGAGILALSLCGMGMALSASMAMAQAQFTITPVVEKKVSSLPDGPLYWQVENFPTLAEATAAAGPTALAAEVEGKVWLITLGAKGAPTHGGSAVTEVGPVARITAPEYLLRLNNAVAPTGTHTSTHTHPGSEAFYVLAGQLSQRTPEGVAVVNAGGTMPGKAPVTTMEVSSTGTADMHALVMFVVDATKPFSSPSHFD